MGGSALKKTPAIMDEILERLATGEPLSVICRSSDRMPARQKVHEWRAQDPDFAAKFQDAKDCGRDSIAWKVRATARGEGDSTGDVLRDRLIIDTDLKLLAAWDGRYNQKVQHVGSDGEGPIRTETNLTITFVKADGSTHSKMETGEPRSGIGGPKLIQGGDWRAI